MSSENFLRVKCNQKQQSKISWKRSEALKISEAIFNFCADNGINLPATWNEYKSFRETGCNISFKEYDTKGKIVGKRVIYCVDNAQHWDLHETINLYYKIRSTNYALYANFENHGVTIPQMIMAWYTKHRLDPVWLMRKSQLIRRLYLNYFDVATVQTASGQTVKLTDHLQPYHLTLTVPHKGGSFAGQQFYAKELNAFFLMLRRSKTWKANVHAGEYGIEVKPNTLNGLHIHIHSLLFLKEGAIEDVFAKFIKRRWKALTGATELHFEKLYINKKEFESGCVSEPAYEVINGKKLRKTKLVADETGQLHKVQAFKYKKYITPGSNVEDYMKGVMECIKYHFKTDSITDENGNYDVPLISNILNNSKGLRFYSKFGEFYNEPLLNFDNLKTTEPEEDEVLQVVDSEDNPEENIKGKAQTAVDNLINPFSGELAKEHEYFLAVAKPEHLKYSGKKSLVPYSLLNYNDQLFLEILDKNAGVKDIVKCMVNHKLNTITGQRRAFRKNTIHSGYYEYDWFKGEANLVSENQDYESD